MVLGTRLCVHLLFLAKANIFITSIYLCHFVTSNPTESTAQCSREFQGNYIFSYGNFKTENDKFCFLKWKLMPTVAQVHTYL